MTLYSTTGSRFDWIEMCRFFERRGLVVQNMNGNRQRAVISCSEVKRASGDSWWAWADPAPVLLLVNDQPAEGVAHFQIVLSGYASRFLIMIPGVLLLAAALFEVFARPERAFQTVSILVGSIFLAIFFALPAFVAGASFARMVSEFRRLRRLTDEYLSK